MPLFKTQKDRDNELKIALLSFLSKTQHAHARMVSPGEKSTNFSFETIFNNIKSIKSKKIKS